MIDIIKEYIPVAFFFVVVCNIILRVVYSKKKKIKNRKRRGGSFSYISYILNWILCIITFGFICRAQNIPAKSNWPEPPDIWIL
jgi:hypothetical protein